MIFTGYPGGWIYFGPPDISHLFAIHPPSELRVTQTTLFYLRDIRFAERDGAEVDEVLDSRAREAVLRTEELHHTLTG